MARALPFSCGCVNGLCWVGVQASSSGSLPAHRDWSDTRASHLFLVPPSTHAPQSPPARLQLLASVVQPTLKLRGDHSAVRGLPRLLLFSKCICVDFPRVCPLPQMPHAAHLTPRRGCCRLAPPSPVVLRAVARCPAAAPLTPTPLPLNRARASPAGPVPLAHARCKPIATRSPQRSPRSVRPCRHPSPGGTVVCLGQARRCTAPSPARGTASAVRVEPAASVWCHARPLGR